MFEIKIDKWKELNGYNTANEIYQQPEIWNRVLNIIEDGKAEIESFFENMKSKKNHRVIFTGAGSSAYLGNILANYLNKKEDYIKYEAIATTDIVNNPNIYFKSHIPTILVSFARSGNSPESIATYNLGNQIVKDISHIFITCNENGELAKIAKENNDILLIQLPKESNDKAFAMTSSFSSMTLAALLAFNIDDLNILSKDLQILIDSSNNILNEGYKKIDEILKNTFSKVIYIGSGSYFGLAKESGLKILELTRGKISVLSETSLGFRHGPKSFMDDETLIFNYISEDVYARQYDTDLLNEIYHNPGNHKIISITQRVDSEIEKISDYNLNLDLEEIMENEVLVSLGFLLYAQIISLKASLLKNIEPDNPSPSGMVNRVVQGVKIYQYRG